MAGPVTSCAGVIAAERDAGDRQPWLTLAVLAALWLLSLSPLAIEWTVNPQYTYGWTVPILAIYLFAERWKSRPATLSSRSPWILATLLAALGLCLLPLRLISEATPDWRLISWAAALTSVVLTLGGVYYAGGRRWLLHFAVPVCFVLIAVPWPVPLERQLIQKLMTVVASVCVEALSFFSIPAVQQGNVIVISTGKVGVEEACSGVRSLQTTLMAAIFLGELFRFGVFRRATLLIAGLALAFLCNLGRSFYLVWISVHEGTASALRQHDAIGLYVLLASLGGLALLCALLRPRRSAEPEETPDLPLYAPRFAPRTVLIGALCWLGLVELSTELWYRSHERGPSVSPWTVDWPTQGREFREIPIGDTARSMLRFDQGRSVAWIEPNGFQWSMIFLRWEPGRASKQLARSHGPEVCLPAAGAALHSDFGVAPLQAGPHELPVHRYLFRVRDLPLFVGFCLWEQGSTHDAPQSTRTEMTMESRMRDVLAGRRNTGQQVIELAVIGPRSQEEADAAIAQMIARVVKS